MSKLNVGVGEDFPLDDTPKNDQRLTCEDYRRMRHMHHARWRHRRRGGPVAAILILPLAAASVTTAILYPLATLGVIGGLGLAGAAYRHGRYTSDTRKPEPPKTEDDNKPKDTV